MNAESNYYPSDREIMAAKVSEIVAECIRVSDEMPAGQYLSFNFGNSHIFTVDYVINGQFECSYKTRHFVAYMGWENASRRLDKLLAWVRGFGLDACPGQMSLEFKEVA